MTTIFDTNALIAMLDESEPNNEWALTQLENCKAQGVVVIPDIVYSELSVGMASKAEIDDVIQTLGLERLPSKDDALFNAGKAYKLYKSRSGTKTNVLPDFLIGAAAMVENAPLVTANAKDFTGYFPGIQIIAP